MAKNIKKTCGVYKITNPKGESYIGRSKNIEARWCSHCSTKSDLPLYRSMREFGVDAHELTVLIECPEEASKVHELDLIRALQPVFNTAIPRAETGMSRLSIRRVKSARRCITNMVSANGDLIRSFEPSEAAVDFIIRNDPLSEHTKGSVSREINNPTQCAMATTTNGYKSKYLIEAFGYHWEYVCIIPEGSWDDPDMESVVSYYHKLIKREGVLKPEPAPAPIRRAFLPIGIGRPLGAFAKVFKESMEGTKRFAMPPEDIQQMIVASLPTPAKVEDRPEESPNFLSYARPQIKPYKTEVRAPIRRAFRPAP